MFYLKEIPVVIKKKIREKKIEVQLPRGRINHSRFSIPHFNLKNADIFNILTRPG